MAGRDTRADGLPHRSTTRSRDCGRACLTISGCHRSESCRPRAARMERNAHRRSEPDPTESRATNSRPMSAGGHAVLGRPQPPNQRRNCHATGGGQASHTYASRSVRVESVESAGSVLLRGLVTDDSNWHTDTRLTGQINGPIAVACAVVCTSCEIGRGAESTADDDIWSAASQASITRSGAVSAQDVARRPRRHRYHRAIG